MDIFDTYTKNNIYICNSKICGAFSFKILSVKNYMIIRN